MDCSVPGPGTAASRAERREAIGAALEKLDPVNREILWPSDTWTA